MPLRLPPPDLAALLLDLDGTLLDIAPTPGEVVVPAGLADALLRLRHRLGGALAIVTGRPVEQIDALLPGVPYAVAGEHGGAVRHAPGTDTVRASLPSPPDAWLTEAARVAAAHPGVLLERKQRGFVLHYRAVPGAGAALQAALAALVADQIDRFQLMPAAMAWEVRPRGADKGSAVRDVMGRAPFARRLPIFIGDDVTDQDGVMAAQAMGGAGVLLPDAFGGPAGVRAWLTAAADSRAPSWPIPVPPA